MTDISVDRIDEALVTLALLMQERGERGVVFLPIFERLEAEREKLASLDDRIARVLARAKGRSSGLPQATNSNRRYSRISAA